MTVMTFSPGGKWFLLRDAVSGAGLMVVEADHPAQACERGVVVQRHTGLFAASTVLAAEEWQGITALPTFLDAFFALAAEADRRRPS